MVPDEADPNESNEDTTKNALDGARPEIASGISRHSIFTPPLSRSDLGAVHVVCFALTPNT